MERLQPRLSLAQAAMGLMNGGFTPFFGAYLAGRGIPAAGIGLTLSAGLLLQAVIAPLGGIVADARNDRRGAMIVLYAAALAGFGALFFVHGPLAIAAVSVPAIIAIGAALPLLESVSVRLSERFGFDYGHVRRWASILYVGGNLAAGLLISAFGSGALAWWLSGTTVLTLLAVIALPRAVREPGGDPFLPRLRQTLAEARILMRSGVFVVFLAAAGMDQGSHAFYYAYGALNWRHLGLSGALIGLIWPLGVLAEIALMSMSRGLFARFGAARLMLLACLACVLRWTILAFDPPFALVVFAQILHGATFALGHLGAMYFILTAVPHRLNATAQSLYTVCAIALSEGLATAAAGPLYAAYGARTYLLMAAMGAAGVGFSLLLMRGWHRGQLIAGDADERPLTI